MRKLIFYLVVIIVKGFSQSPPNITHFEYYIDTDPGYGLGTNVSIPSSATQSVNFSVNIASVSDGIHMLYLRMKDENYRWSETFNRQFMKVSGAATSANITKAEYFIDTDPGYGNGIPLTFTPGTQKTISFAANVSAISSGIHTIYIRTKDANNRWSQTFNRQFIKVSVPATPANITKAEYFIDTDPGYGNGTNISLSPSTEQSLNFTADLTNVTKGIHVIYIRTKDANKRWSVLFNRQFYKEDVILPAGNIVKAEYFIDTDPGYENGIPLTVISGAEQIISFSADLTTFTNGIHVIYIRTKDANNKWSVTFNRQFIKADIDTSPLSKINLIEYFVDTDPGFGQATQYPIPSGEDSTLLIKDFIATLPDVEPTNHSFYIRVRDANGKWSMTYDTVYCQGPSAKFTVAPVCEGQTSELVYNSNNPDANTSFFWDINNDGSIESNENGSITWDFPNAGEYPVKLVVTNNSICPNSFKDSVIVQVIVNPLPQVSINPENTVSVCPGDIAIMEAQASGVGSYQWYKNDSPVNNATSSTFNAMEEGNYTVVFTVNSNCSATSDITSLSFKPQPEAVIIPDGPTDLCQGGSVILNANTGENLTYQWKLNGDEIQDATTTTYIADLTGTFTLLVTNSEGCGKLSDAVDVNIHPFPVVDLGKDTTITSKQIITLDAGIGYSEYLWNDNSTNQMLSVDGSVLGLGTFDFSVTVTDAYGCSGYDSISIEIVKPVPSISGIVQYENSVLTPLDSVKLYLYDKEDVLIDSTTTDLQGKYKFNKITDTLYTISATTTKKWGGGNTADALLINRNFIQAYEFTSVLKQQAADLNKDSKINPVDALTVNRRFVQLISSFAMGDWIFEYPTVSIKDEEVTQNIKGLCIGDVNGSY